MSDKNSRYPGARPFKDNPLERKLFFGRKDEKKKLLHFILSNNIVVLFAKSGVGKSSLLNAGVFEQLYKKDYFPVSIRLNSPSENILKSIESVIVEIAKEKNVEYVPGKKDSLREFLKTAEFWTEDDKLMTPVLVFDQFEEIFTLGYSEDQRKEFFKQLADLEKIKRKLSKNKWDDSSQYDLDSPPKVKIVLSLREEFLAQLEEISEDIPSILRNRFRLGELTEEQAINAIERPAYLKNENLSSRNFKYTEGAIKAVTDFLMKKDLRERLKIMTKTWDPKWPKWTMIIFAILLLPLKLLLSYLFKEVEISNLIILWLVIPSFIITLSIRKPIAGRNTIVPIILLYTWFFILTLVVNRPSYFNSDEVLLLSIVPTVALLIIVLLICASYRKGRNEMLTHADTATTEINVKSKSWPRKPHQYILGWLIGSMLLSSLVGLNREVGFINFLLIIGYSMVLTIKFPIPPKKTLLLLAGAHFLNGLIFSFIFFNEVGGMVFSAIWILLAIVLLIIIFNLMLLTFLRWSYKRGINSVDPERLQILSKGKDKIAPFQLQLLCQNIEEKVLFKQRRSDTDELITITKKDFGGDKGMRRILLKFYDDQLNKISWMIRGRVRRLCERGLISQSGRRLSIAEDDIISRFNLKKETLYALIDYRLLRAEPRLGSKYYEISHDTLVQPILTSATKHINRNMAFKWIGSLLGLILLIYGINFYEGLINPSDKYIYERMDNILESSSITHTDKIWRLKYYLDRLDKRDKFKWLIMNSENENSAFNDEYEMMAYDPVNKKQLDDTKYNKQNYKIARDSLLSINRSLMKYKNLHLFNSEKKEVHGYSITLGTKPEKFSISLMADSINDGFHNLEIEWHYKQDYYSDFQLLQKLKMDSVSKESKEVTTKSFALSESLCEGYNSLKLYEVDSENPSRRYLLEIRDFNVILMSKKYYQDKIKEEPRNAKYNAHLGFIHYQSGQPKEALAFLNKAIEIKSDYALAYYWRGHVQSSAEDIWSDYLTAYKLDYRLGSALKKILAGTINQVSNGSFEFPKLQDNHYLLTSELGRESIDTIKEPSWENEDGINFDLKSLRLGQGLAKSGEQFIELAGKSSSWIRQKVITERDTDYILSFAYSPRPGTMREDNRMEISWNGIVQDTIERDGRNLSNTRWRTYFFPVKATTESTYIKFRDIGESSGNNVGTGPYLDAVFLVKEQDFGNPK